MGSPPHTREHFYTLNTFFLYTGITPAYAGTLNDKEVRKAVTKDHPRIRGNTASRKASLDLVRGSPPHTREHFSALNNFSCDGRITPAYAGTLSIETLPAPGGGNHPRIRGNT